MQALGQRLLSAVMYGQWMLQHTTLSPEGLAAAVLRITEHLRFSVAYGACFKTAICSGFGYFCFVAKLVACNTVLVDQAPSVFPHVAGWVCNHALLQFLQCARGVPGSAWNIVARTRGAAIGFPLKSICVVSSSSTYRLLFPSLTCAIPSWVLGGCLHPSLRDSAWDVARGLGAPQGIWQQHLEAPRTCICRGPSTTTVQNGPYICASSSAW